MHQAPLRSAAWHPIVNRRKPIICPIPHSSFIISSPPAPAAGPGFAQFKLVPMVGTRKEPVMKSVLVALIGSSLLGVPMIVGCDRTVEEHKTTTSGPGGSSTSEKKTVEHPD